MSQPTQAVANANNNRAIAIVWAILQWLLNNPSLPYADVINTAALHSRIFRNVGDDLWSSAIAAIDMSATNALILILVSRLAVLTLTPPINPHSFSRNRNVYARNILNILRNCIALEEVVLPLEFRQRNVQMLRALKSLPCLSILRLRPPTTFTPTEQDILNLQSLLALHLRGFHQVKNIVLPIQLVNIPVIHTLASLDQLGVLTIVPTAERLGDHFATLFMDSGIEQSQTQFRALKKIHLGLDRIPVRGMKKASTVAIFQNRFIRELVVD